MPEASFSVGYLAADAASVRRLKVRPRLCATGIAISRGRTGAPRSPPSSPTRIAPALATFCQSAPDRRTAENAARTARGSASTGPSGVGRRKGNWSVMNCSMKRDWFRKACATGRASAAGILPLGAGMIFDHRRIPRTAIARLRAR